MVKGAAPRWLIPGQSKTTDILLLFANIEKEQSFGLGLEAHINATQIKDKKVAVSKELSSALGLKAGDKISLKIQFSNMLKGGKLVEKYQ